MPSLLPQRYDKQMRQAWGLSTPEEWDNQQRGQWKELVEWNDSSGVYNRLIGYVLFDATDTGFGIVRADHVTPRPTYEWVKQRNGG